MADAEQLSLAKKYNLLPTGNQADVNVVSHDDLLEFDDYRAFVVNPQPMHREEMLNLLFKGGIQRSFSYTHLYSASLDPEIGIAILFSDHIVNIRGLRLLKGYHRVLDRRLVQVAEADVPTARLAKSRDSVVTEMSICDVTPESLQRFGFRHHN